MKRLKQTLAATRHAHSGDKESLQCRVKQTEAAIQWRTTIRRLQWAYWEATFQSTDRNTGFQPIIVGDKKKATMSLPVINGRESFQGKYQVLRDSVFPAIVATPPAMPLGYLPPPL